MTEAMFNELFGKFTTLVPVDQPLQFKELNIDLVEALLTKDVMCVPAQNMFSKSSEYPAEQQAKLSFMHRPGVVLVSQFVLRTNGEKSLYFYVYELLRAFSRFGDRVSDTVEAEFMLAVTDPSNRLPARRLGVIKEAKLREVVVTYEEKVRGSLSQGAVYCCI